MHRIWLFLSIFLLAGTACNKYNPNPKVCLIIGNSTIAKHHDLSSVASFMRKDTSINKDFYICDIAQSGDNISQQTRKWMTLRGKNEIDIVIIQIGLNDLYLDKSALDIIHEYQALVNKIKATGKKGVKVAAATMVPSKRFWLTKMGIKKGTECVEKWTALNNAIMNRGNTSIEGLQYRIEEHTTVLSDADGNLSDKYNSSDDLHENNAGRAVIANVYAKALRSIYNTHNDTIE